MSQHRDDVFEALLEFIRHDRGFDFTGYKRSSLERRIDKRMQAVQVEDYARYQDYLEVHPDEFAQLFNTILINVTSFFRDLPAWEYLIEHVVAPLAAQCSEERPVRVWSAGCASGEEAYTLAMVFAEAMGLERARRCLKIYATDVDEAALEQARHAAYSEKELEAVPEALRARWFQPAGNGRFVFHGDLRRSVIFGRHDLINDAPISRLDLLVCRNTLMYFNAEVQARILARFHFGLKECGHLFVGRAEMLLTHGKLFSPLNLRHRIFSKVPRLDLRDQLAGLRPNSVGNGNNGPAVVQERLEELAFDHGITAQVVVDQHGQLAMANERARAAFSLDRKDLGRPLRDLEISYRPVELRDPLERAMQQGAPIELGRVERHLPDDHTEHLEVTVVPLLDRNGRPLGASVFFDNVSHVAELQGDLERVRQDLETAYEEVQSTNEELETTNEELQSSNEELETTNEELQSANEELETMNEELQSSNDELQEMNRRMRQRSDELYRINAHMDAIVRTLRCAVVAVDQQLNIRLWNEWAEDMWGLHADQVQGTGLLGLDIGLPIERLKPGLRSCLEKSCERYEQTLDGRDRRGRDIRCRITGISILDADGGVDGVVLTMEAEPLEKGRG